MLDWFSDTGLHDICSVLLLPNVISFGIGFKMFAGNAYVNITLTYLLLDSDGITTTTTQ